MNNQLKTPILFIIFNRPETTERVFNEIRKAKPKKLYVVADGPRNTRPDDIQKCIETRKIIDSIDWDCQVFKNYSEINLGCRNRVSSGIDWFFENEESGIILEDDCLPEHTFFQFCEEMLEKYKDNNQIGMISGTNFYPDKNPSESYYFSKYSSIWGWATWRRAWKSYDVDIKNWPENKKNNSLKNIFKNIKDRMYWSSIFDEIYNKRIDTWDYQWTYTCFFNNFFSVVPSRNQISNIGFGGNNSTHTKKISPFANMKTEPIIFPLNHPERFEINSKIDRMIQKNNYPFFRHFAKKLLKNLKIIK